MVYLKLGIAGLCIAAVGGAVSCDHRQRQAEGSLPTAMHGAAVSLAGASTMTTSSGATMPAAVAVALASPPPDLAPAPLAVFVADAPRAPRPGAVAVNVWPFRHARHDYRILTGPGKGDTGHVVLNPPAEDDPHQTWTHALLGQHIERLRFTRDGSLELVALEDIANDLVIAFATPIVILPASLPANQPIESISPITIYDREDRQQVKDRGQASFRVVYDADETLDLPAGRFDCRRIVIRCDATFGLGELHTVTHMYLADGVGLVAERYKESGRILIFPRSSERTMVRVTPAESPGESDRAVPLLVETPTP